MIISEQLGGIDNKHMNINEISQQTIGCAIEVHRELGPGLLESTYQECLIYELRKSGFKVRREVPMPVVYKEVRLEHGYRMDILVEEKLVLELKTVEFLTDVHFAQLMTYLKLGSYPLGLLLNFNVKLMKEGIKRIIN